MFGDNSYYHINCSLIHVDYLGLWDIVFLNKNRSWFRMVSSHIQKLYSVQKKCLSAGTVCLVYSGSRVKSQWVVCYERNRTVVMLRLLRMSGWLVGYFALIISSVAWLLASLPSQSFKHFPHIPPYLGRANLPRLPRSMAMLHGQGENDISKKINNMDYTMILRCWIFQTFPNHVILHQFDFFPIFSLSFRQILSQKPWEYVARCSGLRTESSRSTGSTPRAPGATGATGSWWHG